MTKSNFFSVNVAELEAVMSRLPRYSAKVRERASKGYSIKAAVNDTAEILIYDEIGFFGINASDFATDLKAVTAPKILVRLNSPGGEVFDGFAIYNALKQHPAQVTTQIDGVAASVSSVIALAGDKIVAAKSSFMMIHSPWSIVIGDAAEMRQMADTLDKVRGALAGIYQEKTKASDAQIKTWLDAETWFTADEAKAAGLIDEIMPANSASASANFDLAGFKNAPKALVEKPAELFTPAQLAGISEAIAAAIGTAAKPAKDAATEISIMRQRLALKKRRLSI